MDSHKFNIRHDQQSNLWDKQQYSNISSDILVIFPRLLENPSCWVLWFEFDIYVLLNGIYHPRWDSRLKERLSAECKCHRRWTELWDTVSDLDTWCPCKIQSNTGHPKTTEGIHIKKVGNPLLARLTYLLLFMLCRNHQWTHKSEDRMWLTMSAGVGSEIQVSLSQAAFLYEEDLNVYSVSKVPLMSWFQITI